MEGGAPRRRKRTCEMRPRRLAKFAPPVASRPAMPKKTSTLPYRRSQQPLDHHLLNRLHKAAAPFARKRSSGQSSPRSMDRRHVLARRSLRNPARAYPSILRPEYFPAATAKKLDFVLEEPRHALLAKSRSDSAMATRVLGSPTAAWRILWREMGLRGKQSSTSRLCQPFGGLALSRRIERAPVARLIGAGTRRRRAPPSNPG